jgi:Fe-S-cluster containining protein
MVTNEAQAICAPCNGKCCKRAPGYYLWSDFSKRGVEFDPATMVVKEFCTYYGTFLVIRPRAERDDHGIFARVWWPGTCCNFVDGQGCKLSWRLRPATCRNMNPMECPDQPNFSAAKEDLRLFRSWIHAQDKVLKMVDTSTVGADVR